MRHHLMLGRLDSSEGLGVKAFCLSVRASAPDSLWRVKKRLSAHREGRMPSLRGPARSSHVSDSASSAGWKLVGDGLVPSRAESVATPKTGRDKPVPYGPRTAHASSVGGRASLALPSGTRTTGPSSGAAADVRCLEEEAGGIARRNGGFVLPRALDGNTVWNVLLAACLALLGTTAPAALADQLAAADGRDVISAPVDPSGENKTQDAAAPPVASTAVRSSRMEAAPAKEVALGTDTWTVSHAKNPSGSFLLVRNVSPPDSERVLSVALGTAPERTLAARETSLWSCDALAAQSTLVARATTGETVFAGEVACGDAIYLRSSPAP